jgi:transposase
MKYIMSKETLGKLVLIQGAVEGRYTVTEVARRLNLSTRRVKQIKKAFREQGETAVIHGNSSRHPANYTDEELRAKIITFKKSDIYSETNFTHFMELLAEREGIQISYTALCSILKGAGITSKRKHRSGGRRFRRRKRREAFGEMLQAEASPYDWFGDGKRYVLHGFIDDATGRITGLYFCQNECLMGYLEVLRQTLLHYGLPGELYADKAGIFFVNTKKQENWTTGELLAGKPLDKTQFGSIVEERLGITMISAHTPQAKGRVERLWNTLQDRLPLWLKLEGITGVEQANSELHRYIAIFNCRFSVQAQTVESAFVPLGDSHDLDKLLAVRHERNTDNCGCFSFQNFIFQIDSKRPLAKKKILFLFSQKIGFLALYGDEYFPVSFLGLKNKGCVTHIPDVVKILIQKNYYADGRNIQAA